MSINTMDTHTNCSTSAESPSEMTPHLLRAPATKPELWGLMHTRSVLLREKLERIHKAKSDPVLVSMWRDLVYGLDHLLSTILGRQAALGPSGWAREMRKVIDEKKMPEEQVMLVMAHTLVAMERAFRHKGN